MLVWLAFLGFLSTYRRCRKELCERCEDENKSLPSLLSINKRYELPKVHFLFFEFFLKAAIGNFTWKKRLAEDDTRLAAQAIEARANAVVNNHYFAFLCMYFMKNPNSTLITEYDKLLPPDDAETRANASRRGGTSATSTTASESANAAMATHDLFCADLELIEVSVPKPDDTGNNEDFKVLFPRDEEDEESDDESDDEVKSAKEHDEGIAKEIKDLIERDRQPGGSGDGSSRLSSFVKMKSMVRNDREALLSASTAPDKRRAQKKSRASKTSLRDYAKGSRKSKRNSDAMLGWSPQGKQRLQDMRRIISIEEESGARKKWEVVCKKTCKAAMEANEDDEGFDSNEEAEQFEMEEALMRSELAEAQGEAAATNRRRAAVNV